jgi:hypothetical protein
MSEAPTLTLGQAIDNLYEARAARLAKAQEVKDLQAAESVAKARVLRMLGETGLAKASGMTATASITTDDVPYLEDWNKVYEYVKANDRFDLLQRRLGVVAWRDLYRDGILVPGTSAAVDTDISLTRSKRG